MFTTPTVALRAHLYLLALTMMLVTTVRCTTDTGAACSAIPLGLQSGQVTDQQMQATSTFQASSVGAEQARLNNNHRGGAWCPAGLVAQDLKEYLEIDLLEVHIISGIATQGRFAQGQGKEFAPHYALQYWQPDLRQFVDYTSPTTQQWQLLPGNVD